MKLAWILAAVAARATCGCIVVDSDVITGADLAMADALFAGLPGSQSVGFAPSPGVRRVFSIPELRRLAERASLVGKPVREICVERRTTEPDHGAALAAMHESLPGAHIEIVELSRHAVPGGKLVFPVSQLSRNREIPLLWRGRVEYGDNGVAPIWAKVNVSVTVDVVIATEDLRPGQVITAGQLRSETYQGPPLWDRAISTVAGAVGQLPRSRIPAGSRIPGSLLVRPWDVSRGDTVRVEVRVGAAHISLQAKAASGGRRGDTIQLRNESSGKLFRALVEGPGHAVVMSGRPQS
jgi:flagella basal body P-ring formation protein FlgA